MEHLAKAAEMVLAVFGSMKFCHEVIEVIHHLRHLLKK